MTAPIVVATFAKNSREHVRVALDSFKGVDTLDIRVFVPGSGAGDLKPTRAGLTIRRALLPDLLAAVRRAAEIDGALPPEGGGA